MMNEFDELRIKWQELLVGKGNDIGDSDVAYQIETITLNAMEKWETLNKEEGRLYLWNELSNWSKSTTITKSYSNIRTMAIAYVTEGSPLKGNIELSKDIIEALDWLYNNHYNENAIEIDNWWDWEIGTPKILNDIMCLIYDNLLIEKIKNYISAIDKWCPNATNRVLNNAEETGANRADKALVLIIRGIIGQEDTKIIQGRDALSQIFKYVKKGDGYYEDGSFIAHNYVPYTAGYGNVLLDDMANTLHVLKGCTWDVLDPAVNNVYDWIIKSYEPLIFKGGMMDIVHGRGISRKAEQEHAIGKSIIGSITLLSQSASLEKSKIINEMVKEWIVSDSTFVNYYTDVPAFSIYKIQLLKLIMNDSSIIPRGDLVGNYLFPSMDRVVNIQEDFAFSVSMFSDRISSFEYGNGENNDGWWYGVGRTNLYNDDLNQYSENSWATINRYRLSGITGDGSGIGIPIDWKDYSNPYNWVGGSSVDKKYSSVGMQFSLIKNTGSPLEGKKSWFLVGDKIVAIGSGISNSNDSVVETIVENRKLNENGDNGLVINGVTKSNLIGWNEVIENCKWAHLDGNVERSSIGYYFPETSNIYGLREARTGSWNEINSSEGATMYKNNYLSLAFNHGINPQNGNYSYVLLPNKTVEETENYANNPDIFILEKSESIHSVRNTSENIIGINFWNDENNIFLVDGVDFISCDRKSSITTQEKDGEFSIGISDPTQKNSEVINIEINRSALGIVSLDSSISITQFAPTIKMRIDVNGAMGKTFNAKFKLISEYIPNAPILEEAKSNSSEVELFWSSTGKESGYIIKYGVKAGEYDEVINISSVCKNNRYTVEGLTNGVEYYFCISSVNSLGESINSNELSAIPEIKPSPTMTILTSDDSFVRDGSYSGDNYGASTSMTVKVDNTGYSRQSYMKFDLSEIKGTINSAIIQIVPVTVGMENIQNQANLVEDNMWNESSITWNNKPIATKLLSTWNVMKINSIIKLDVTEEVVYSIEKGEKLSICISGVNNQGSNGTVSYATKENANSLYKPILIINSLEK